MNSDAPSKTDGSPNGVDLAAFPAAAKLVERVGEFMQEIQNVYVSALLWTIPIPQTHIHSLIRSYGISVDFPLLTSHAYLPAYHIIATQPHRILFDMF